MDAITAKARQLARPIDAPIGSYDIVKEAIAFEMADWMENRMLEKLNLFLKNYENTVIITDANKCVEEFKQFIKQTDNEIF